MDGRIGNCDKQPASSPSLGLLLNPISPAQLSLLWFVAFTISEYNFSFHE